MSEASPPSCRFAVRWGGCHGARRLEAFSLSICADRAGDLEAQREAALCEHLPYLQLSFFGGESRRAAQATCCPPRLNPLGMLSLRASSRWSWGYKSCSGAQELAGCKKNPSPFQLEPVTPQLTWEHLAQEAEQQLEASSD